MEQLTDYLDDEALLHLEQALSAVVRREVRLCRSDGAPLEIDRTTVVRAPTELTEGTEGEIDAADGGSGFFVPLRIRDRTVGGLRLANDHDEPAPQWPRRLLRLMSHVIGHLCEREQQLRWRVDELAALFHVTSEFTNQHDLQSLLDVVARSVAEALGAKACSIRLIDEDRTELVVRAVYNLTPEYLNKGRILLSESSIDRETLGTLEPVYVADQQTDPRVIYPEHAQREGLVSALCVPLAYKGRAEGVIRVHMDRQYRFDWFEVSLLKAMAAQAAAAIVNARLYGEAVASANMKRQIALAGEVQRRMIPDGAPKIPGFDTAAMYVPSYELSGDFYDFIALPENNWGVAICDVVGKGLRASLLTASIRASLRGHAVNVYEMSLVLDKVNRDLCADTLVSDFATMFYGVLDTTKRWFTYANAGHLPPLLVRDGKVHRLGTGGTVLGIEPDFHYDTRFVVLQPGDLVMMYTDGLPEAMDFQDRSFGNQRVEQTLLEAVEMGLAAEATLKHVAWTMRKHTGLQRRLDDLTMVAFRAV